MGKEGRWMGRIAGEKMRGREGRKRREVKEKWGGETKRKSSRKGW